MFILHAYYIALQTYVLRIDIVMNAIAFVFTGLETFLCIVSMVNIFVSTRRI